MDMTERLPPDAPRPRLCHLRKWENFQGYGFNLHTEKGKPGQYIGKVDPESPAESAGLREGDRIIEVNGTNVSMENHQQVVERIKAVPDETTFLVVDDLTDAYYRERKMLVCSRLTDVDEIETPARVPRHCDVINGNGLQLSAEYEKFGDAIITNGSDEPTVKRRGRLCHLLKWPDFPGYGFNLHAEKGKPGQYIGVVDSGSPAEAVGLHEGDRIVGVNGDDVIDRSHHDVVASIKSVPHSVALFVIDPETERSMIDAGVKLSLQTIESIETFTCPDTNPNRAATPAPAVSETSEAISSSINVGDEVQPPTDCRPRLCHIRLWHDGKGFGFNMLAHRGRSGQFIGTVDPGSPAEFAGLRDGDRIIEVNGTNIENDDHKQVVEKIRAVSDETRLLVVDPVTDAYFTSNGIAVTSSLKSVQHVTCPGTNPSLGDGGTVVDIDTKLVINAVGQVAQQEDSTSAVDYEQITNEIAELAIAESANIDLSPRTPEITPEVASLEVDDKAKDVANETSLPSVTSTTLSTTESEMTNNCSEQTTPKTSVIIGGLEFAGSAEEARRRMSKKKDVRSTSMSIKDKYDLFQRL